MLLMPLLLCEDGDFKLLWNNPEFLIGFHVEMLSFWVASFYVEMLQSCSFHLAHYGWALSVGRFVFSDVLC